MNITGLVKYVGKLGGGRNNGSMFVGLKLDQPGIDSHHNFVLRPRCLKQSHVSSRVAQAVSKYLAF